MPDLTFETLLSRQLREFAEAVFDQLHRITAPSGMPAGEAVEAGQVGTDGSQSGPAADDDARRHRPALVASRHSRSASSHAARDSVPSRRCGRTP